MSISKTQAERLGAMANAIRPDWPIRSLVTMIGKHHQARPYRDLAVALAWIATDPTTKTPGRLAEPGPWWSAAAADTTNPTTSTPPGKCNRCGSFARTPAGACLDCEITEQRVTENRRRQHAATARQAIRTGASS